jgi:hypothetical protein
MRNTTRNLLIAIALGFAVCAFGTGSNARAQNSRAALSDKAITTQQPLYSEYKGIRLGMTATEVRAKLGEPALKDNDQDYYVISDNERAQIAYDSMHKVVTISIDYMGGLGAPNYKTIVGTELETTTNGSLYKIVRYDQLGFWVSYNRTPGPVIVITVTIQKIR